MKRFELFGFDLSKVYEYITDKAAIMQAVADVKEKKVIKKDVEVVEDVGNSDIADSAD